MRLRVLGVCVVVAGAWCAPALGQAGIGPDRLPVDGAATLDEVWREVAEHFVDPEMNGVDWEAARLRYRDRAAEARTRAEAGVVINEMLGLLETSHTRYFHQEEARFYELLDVFNQSEGPGRELAEAIFSSGVVRVPSIGVVTRRTDEGWFVWDVLHGSPAAEAGVLVGDRIVSAEGEAWDPIYSLVDGVGAPIRLEVQRSRGGETEVLWVDVERVVPHEAFERDMRESVRVFERGAARIGYVRVYSFAGEQYYLTLRSLVSSEPLAGCDALVLDLRGGWGGAQPQYLHLVSRRAPRLSFKAREGAWQDIGTGGVRPDVEPARTRPAVMLVDAGSRSGKEILAHGFKTQEIGPLVGERTAGAVVGGRLVPLSSGDAVYVAVSDVRVDGLRLEGVGVMPDVVVGFEREWSGGVDPQLERALEVAGEIAFGRPHTDGPPPR